MNNNEEKQDMEKDRACEGCGYICPLYRVSCQYGSEGFISEYWLCEPCLNKLRKLRREKKVRYVILQRPELSKLAFLRDAQNE